MHGSGLRYAALIGLAALTCTCSASNAQRDTPFSPERVAGCYRLELYPDESGADIDERRARWDVPQFVVLESDSLTTWPSLLQQYGTVFVAASITQDGQVRDHPFNYWRPAADDSVHVGHPGALAGVSLALRIEGQDLRGEVVSFSDVRVEGRPSTVTSPVRARRVECPTVGR
jgi:hypothetical protein